MEKIIELLRGEVTVSYRGDRHFLPPWGLDNGKAAKPWVAVICRRDGEREEIPSKAVFTLRAGDQLLIYAAGGGGFGDPLDRDPARVRSDVVDRKVSASAALEEYGVVLEAGGSIDVDATTAKRREMRKHGSAVTG